jgi:hypothetical protein
MCEGCANFAFQESYYKKHLNIIVTKKKKKKTNDALHTNDPFGFTVSKRRI